VYVAGAFERGGDTEDLRRLRERGAYGLQVGSRFALSNESGLRRDIKDALLSGADSPVRTDACVSPTGYPFKVADLPGTVANPEVYAARKRLCDKGYLMRAHVEIMEDGTRRETYLCPAMPAAQYAKLSGDPAECEGKLCLCDGLLAGVGYEDGGRRRRSEPALVTLGVSGARLTERRTARQVVEDVLGAGHVAAAERDLLLDP